jgi:SAM-dependent methyltransferase
MQIALAPKLATVSTPNKISWEEAPCPNCACRHYSTLIEAQDPMRADDGLWFAVVQCDSCGTCFTNPRPDAASMSQFYPPEYSPYRRRDRKVKKRRWPNPFRWLKQPRVEKRPIAWHGKGRLLDFGCGSGSYLLQMRRLGWDVTGLDLSREVIEYLRDELGLRAYVGTLPHLELEPESFDVITMWHSLEHVHEPAPLLREARRLLAPGGKVVIAVPNIDSLPFRWFGQHWFGLELPRHLTHFTPTSLLQMLQRCGFATEPIRYIRHADWLQTSAKRACSRIAAPPSWMRSLRYRLPCSAVTWYSWFTQQSDCILAVAHR